MKIGKILNDLLFFDCPGCECSHHIDPDKWTFNFDFDRPTVSPSILVRATKPITDTERAFILAGGRITPIKTVCHSFIKNGMIEFLSDSTHNLAGQTVELPEIE